MRNLIAIACLIASVSCSAPSPVPSAPAAEVDPIRFGAVPTGDSAVRQRELTPIAAWLGRKLGQPVEIEVPADYTETTRRLAEKRWDLVLLGPILYSRANALGYQAAAMPVRGGSSVFQGVIFARGDAGIRSLDDLRGKRVAFVDPNSSAGFQYPFALLFANQLRPQEYERAFVGSHREVVRRVLEGEYAAGACYEDALAEAIPAERRGELVVLARTEPVPGDVLATRADSPRAQAVREALLSLSGDQAREVLAPLRAEGLQAPEEALFDSARRIDLLVSEEAGL